MQEINHKNLDEWLFEYFEGNLSEAESEHLLREVGGNNDFIEEFNSWKQSYLKEYPSIQYSNSDKLKKKPLWKTYWPSIPIIAIAFFLIGYVSFNSSETIETTKPSRGIMEENKYIDDSKVNHAVIKGAAPDNKKVSKSYTKGSFNKIISEESKGGKEISNIHLSEVTINIDTITAPDYVEASPKETSVENENIISNKEQTPSLKEAATTQTKENKKAKAKPLRLKNMHFQPSEEINKMNSDF